MPSYKQQLEDLVGFELVLQASTKTLDDKGLNSKCHFVIKEARSTAFGKIVSTFDLAPMPGCCGIVVSTAVSVDYAYRKRGIGTILNQMRVELAHILGYGILLCTDIDANTAQKRVLEKNNWKHIDQFTNPRTGNVINLHTHICNSTGVDLGFEV